MITTEELKKWILSQPDDRPVNMAETVNDLHLCGCVMTQYGREKGIDFHFVGEQSFFHFENNNPVPLPKCTLDTTIYSLFSSWREAIHCETFGELKPLLV